MRLKRGELHGLVSGGMIVAILGLTCGLGALVVAVGPSQPRRSRFWTPGHPGYPAYPPQLRPPYPEPEPGYAEPGYAEPGYAEPGYAEPGHAGWVYPGPGYAQAQPGADSMTFDRSGARPAGQARGPFDAYDQFASGPADTSVAS